MSEMTWFDEAKRAAAAAYSVSGDWADVVRAVDRLAADRDMRVEVPESAPAGDGLSAARRLLDLPLPANNAGASTARAWLAELLKVAWQAGSDAFKRPFGFSGPWQDDIYRAMITAGIVHGEFDEDGDPARGFDFDAADKLILTAIGAMGTAPAPVSPDLSCARCGGDGQ